MKTLLMTLFGLILLLSIFVFFISVKNSPSQSEFINLSHVRGAAIQHQENFYTLNFDQQKEFIALINESKISKEPSINRISKAIDQIVLYLFDHSELHFFPNEEKEILKLQVEKNDQLFLVELNQPQQFNHLLHSSYDP